jgi:hypothetical protein
LEQAPVGFGEALEEFTDFKVIAGHGPDLRDQFLANIFGDGLLLDLEGEVIAALGGILVEGALEQFEATVDLTLELFLAEAEEFGLFTHSMRIYTHTIGHANQPVKRQSSRVGQKEGGGS